MTYEPETVGYVNVTDPDGVLLGRFPVSEDDLIGSRHLEYIGRQVREQFPNEAIVEDRSDPEESPDPGWMLD